MVRGGLSYGPVIHGGDIGEEAFSVAIDENVRKAILLSPAMVSATSAESKAPPFGIYVDNNAKTAPILSDSEDNGFISSLYQWWRSLNWDEREKHELITNLYTQVIFYLDKAVTHSIGMNYSKDRIEWHRQLAEEYLGGYTINASCEQDEGL